MSDTLSERIDGSVAGPKAIGIEGDDASPMHSPPAGDMSDDDGTFIDEMFEPNPNPTLPTFPGHLVPNVAYDDGPDPATRIVSTLYVITVAADPVQAFPRDADRKSLTIQIVSGTAADQVRLASEKSDVYGAGALQTGQVYKLEHSGAVWLYAPTGTGPITVHLWALTK